ncbi:MAG TPA: thioredoxin-like domain-containing protein [Flavitalea sp.]|nr:thioredoxin-like domain-containing protein [Flavitalea sp.]
MKHLFLLFLVCIASLGSTAQQGYNIKIALKPYKSAKIYLGYYYGKMKAIADSTILNENSIGSFAGKESLHGGIYFLVSPKKEILFEVLIDKDQDFSITADTTNLPGSVIFSGTTDNTQFQSYSAFANQTGQAITRLNEELKSTNAKDSAAINSKIRTLSRSLTAYRDSVGKIYSASLLSMLFNAIREPEIPPASSHPGGKYDSNYAYQYYKSNYWKGVSLGDERLVRTPFFEPKLEKYYRELVHPNADSIKNEIDAMLLQARGSQEMFKYLLVHFVQKYINPEYMGLDAVFVHLFEKYINTGQAEFFTAQYKDFMTKRAYSLMANLIGQPAANLEMVDTSGKSIPLYNIQSDYTVVVFWDPGCSHCKEVVPKVNSIYKAKWKNRGVVVYAVKTEGTREDWVKFINEHKLTGWLHVYQLPEKQAAESAAGRPGYRQLYDVYQTPILYLLDKDKRIIAKKLTYLQMDEVINLKSRTAKSN